MHLQRFRPLAWYGDDLRCAATECDAPTPPGWVFYPGLDVRDAATLNNTQSGTAQTQPAAKEAMGGRHQQLPDDVSLGVLPQYSNDMEPVPWPAGAVGATAEQVGGWVRRG